MTIKKRTTISPKDIISVEFECTRCHTCCSIPIDKVGQNFTVFCPNCEQRWLKETPLTSSSLSGIAAMKAFIIALRELLDINQDGATVRLEISDILPSDEDAAKIKA